jgi:trehalose 6-phosphate synthase
MHRTIAISNRVHALDNPDACSGGLAVGLRAALEETGGLWIGWSGRVATAPGDALSIQTGSAFTLATFDLTESEHAGYYLEFANGTLWPLLHDRPDLARFDLAELGTYLSVARKFARHAAPLVDRSDVVWVHDYQLIPVGQHLRWLGVLAPIGFFLHTPFPTADVLTSLPCHRDLVLALNPRAC